MLMLAGTPGSRTTQHSLFATPQINEEDLNAWILHPFYHFYSFLLYFPHWDWESQAVENIEAFFLITTQGQGKGLLKRNGPAH